jgi:hypothetical protein
MRHFIVLILFLFCHAVASANDGAPQGKNCHLTAPPADAGEEFNHGMTFRIYPRAKNIDANYTGCQAVFVSDGQNWVVMSLTEVIKGDPVRIWSPDGEEQDAETRACRFKDGKVVRGNSETCPAPKSLLQRSMAPGCARKIQESIAKNGMGAPRPSECEYE